MLLKNHYRGELCDSNLSYEFIPLSSLKIPLKKIGMELEKKGFLVEINTPFLVSVRMDGIKISLFSNAKILIKNVSDEKQANSLFEELLEILNSCPSMGLKQ